MIIDAHWEFAGSNLVLACRKWGSLSGCSILAFSRVDEKGHDLGEAERSVNRGRKHICNDQSKMGVIKHKVLMNVDLGEAYGNYKCGPDEELIEMIDHANVACGFHAG